MRIDCEEASAILLLSNPGWPSSGVLFSHQSPSPPPRGNQPGAPSVEFHASSHSTYIAPSSLQHFCSVTKHLQLGGRRLELHTLVSEHETCFRLATSLTFLMLGPSSATAADRRVFSCSSS